MKIIDISGPIFNGMWSYGKPYPEFNHTKDKIDYCGDKYSIDILKGMHGQTGTCLESTSAFANKREPLFLDNISLEKLFMIEAYVLKIPHEELGKKDNKSYITIKDIKKAEKDIIPEGSAILVGTGYGKNWEKENFPDKGWFFKKYAFEYLLDKKPFMLGGDSPNWENTLSPEGIFEKLYNSGIICISPCINLEKIKSFKVNLTVLPLKILKMGICPARAVVAET